MRRLTLGPYGPLTVEQARKLAATHIGAIAQGEDPAEIRQDRIHEPTFADLTSSIRAACAAQALRAATIGGCSRPISRTFAQGSSRTSPAMMLRASAQGSGRRPLSRQRLVALLRKMFNLARDWGLYAGENPATRIQIFREESRDRFLQPDELPRVFPAIAEEADASVRGVLLTALLTGARRTKCSRCDGTR